MSEVALQMCFSEQIGETEAMTGTQNQGTLQTEGKDYTVHFLPNSEDVSAAVDKFLQQANLQKCPKDALRKHDFAHITQERVEIEAEINELLEHLEKSENVKDNQPLSKEAKPKSAEKQNASASSQGQGQVRPQVFSSLFSLARSVNSSLTQSKQKKESDARLEKRAESRDETKISLQPLNTVKVEQKPTEQSRFDREGNGKQDRDRQNEEKEEQQKKALGISGVKAAKEVTTLNAEKEIPESEPSQNKSAKTPLGGIENIYVRFMALMARILGQSESEAHQLYLRIKERTDAIDSLTGLIAKINSEKGAIDWTNNVELKKMVDHARTLGVDIPEGKYQWTEDEKKLLKENIQMRKDSMEKMTQLERTDMQRYLQESSQCHQARSNVLKLLKEVIDTFIHNIRPA